VKTLFIVGLASQKVAPDKHSGWR